MTPLAWATFASLGAGLVHFAVVREHLDEWQLAGIFFVALGLLQTGWSLASLAARRLVAPRAVATANLLTVVLWAVSRTVGLPFGPEAGHPEAVGRADVLACGLEVLLAISVAVAITRRTAAGRGRLRTAGGFAVAALVVAALTTPALAATHADHEGHMAGMHAPAEDTHHA